LKARLPEQEPPVLEALHITKDFESLRALNDVSIQIVAGRIHALAGHNGAGKSTLLGILSGRLQPDSGTVVLRGTPIDLASPAHAIRLGIELIPQELCLVPDLSLAENVVLGQYPTRSGLVRWEQVQQEAKDYARLLDIRGDIRRPIAGLKPVDQRLAMIARALRRKGHVLIMDEPTASLGSSEIERLFTVLRQLEAQGIGIVFCSHQIDELFAIASEVTVLRDGRTVVTTPISQTSPQDVMQAITGVSAPPSSPPIPAVAPGGTKIPLLSVQHVIADRINDVSFDLNGGEVLGITGLAGSGCSELGRVLFGATEHRGGRILVSGRVAELRNPRDAIKVGVAYIPSDRRAEGGILSLSVATNVTLSALGAVSRWRSLIAPTKEKLAVENSIRQLNVKPAEPSRPLGTLSGGNQQKVLLAKWLLRRFSVLVCEEPTAGIDVAGKREVDRILRDLAQRQLGVIVISTDVKHLVTLASRIIVLREGKVVANLVDDQVDEQTALWHCYQGRAARSSESSGALVHVEAEKT
jgi:ABC-type sugar transport system ATPase subunit